MGQLLTAVADFSTEQSQTERTSAILLFLLKYLIDARRCIVTELSVRTL